MDDDRCSWCGARVTADDGVRVGERAGERRAVFCRLEHVVPWAIRGAHWDPGVLEVPNPGDEDLQRCARCQTALDPERRIVLVRHRGEHRIADAVCGVEHLQEWARAGGRWAAG